MTLGKGSWLRIGDNSGAKQVKLLTVYSGKHTVGASIGGDHMLVLIKKALPHKKVKKGDRFKAVLLHSRVLTRRTTGLIKCQRNLAVLLKKGENIPLANRILSKVLFELRLSGFFRVALISKGFF